MTFPIDEQYILDAPQDPNEQVWETDANIADMQNIPGGASATDNESDTIAVRTAKGHLDFLTDLVEDSLTFLERDVRDAPKGHKADAVDVKPVAAQKFRTRTANVVSAASNAVMNKSDCRRRLTMWNNGPNVAYLSSISAVAGGPNTVPIPVTSATLWAPIVIETQDDVWLVCALTQTATVCIIEEFDQP